MARGAEALPGLLPVMGEKAQSSLTFLRMTQKMTINIETGCWDWIGAKQSNGYGRLWDGKKSSYAHRVSYEIFYGAIGNKLDIDHLCRNRCCVNPLHLEPVTRSLNLKRGDAGENIARPLREKTHCPKGHPYFGENLTTRNGRRHCKACARIRYHNTKDHHNGK